jgi:hypothetical protein
VDYFTGAGLDSLCAYGGNRQATAVVYLTDVAFGGETDFPWLRRTEKPKTGKLLVIDYNCDVAAYRRRSEHIELPPILGEKITATVYIRQYSVNTKITERVRNLHYRIQPADTSFKLWCGPTDDQRMLDITLPANYNPSNTIMLGLTGGMDSSLLLYLVAALNTMQSIPYHIQPVVIDNRLGSSDNPNNKFASPINELWSVIRQMIVLIRDKLPGSNILDLIKASADPQLKHSEQIAPAMLSIFKKKNRHFEYKYIYQAITENPPELPGGPDRPPAGGVWIMPLANLQKTHVVDALIQLELQDVIELSSKCPDNHTSLREQCWFWQCNERRWAFDRLGRQDLGEKYFLNIISSK